MDGVDEYDIKKQVEVLNDTLTVIPDTRARLHKYAQDLNEFLELNYKDQIACESAESPDQTRELLVEARQLLKDTGVPFGTDGDDVAAAGTSVTAADPADD